jgi:uncharacterized protein (DUF2147 family)
MISSVRTIAHAISFLVLAAPVPAIASQPYGIWSKGNVTVKVANCGGKLCGNIVALRATRAISDANNPDVSKRNRSLVGLPVLIEMKPSGNDEWRGFIYNPVDGITYAATISILGNALVVNGCLEGGFCSTNKFARK